MNNKVKIALLDTGVNASHPHLKNTIVKCYDVVNLGQEYQVVLLEDMNNDYNGHGTACASVIKK
jgi:subtilisin family serine protease